MNRLSNHYEKEYKIENKVKSAMTYPIILALVSIAVVVFLLTTVMPTFVEMYTSSGVELPRLTQTLIKVSQTIKQYWHIMLMAILGLTAGVISLNKVPKIKYKEDYYKLKLPLLKIYCSKYQHQDSPGHFQPSWEAVCPCCRHWRPFPA